MSAATEFTGRALIGRELEDRSVRITVENGIIVSIEETHEAAHPWICPALFNAHTHLGDTVAMDIPLQGRLSDTVTPPDGLKHRILRSMPEDALIAGMRASIRYMVQNGTGGFADFREGGVRGVDALRTAAAGLPGLHVIFGRDGGERVSDGLGVSSVRDIEDAESLAAEAKKSGKLLAFHAGEQDSNDVDGALAFEPDLLIHCTHATDRQLKECAGRGIPIAVCPRSNWIFGVSRSPDHPPIRRMLDYGCEVLIGTDNVMAVQPDMLQELAFISMVYRIQPQTLLRAGIQGSQVFGVPFFIEEGAEANFFVVSPEDSNLGFSHDPWASIVKRVNISNIRQNIIYPRD